MRVIAVVIAAADDGQMPPLQQFAVPPVNRGHIVAVHDRVPDFVRVGGEGVQIHPPGEVLVVRVIQRHGRPGVVRLLRHVVIGLGTRGPLAAHRRDARAPDVHMTEAVSRDLFARDDEHSLVGKRLFAHAVTVVVGHHHKVQPALLAGVKQFFARERAVRRRRVQVCVTFQPHRFCSFPPPQNGGAVSETIIKSKEGKVNAKP